MTEYYYRRKIGAKDLLPAAGIGAVAGLVTLYIVQLLIQRTPLTPSSRLAVSAGEPTVPRQRAG